MTGHRSIRVTRVALTVLLAASGFSIAGLVALQLAPSAVAIFGRALPWLIRIPTWAYMVALPTAVFAAALPTLGWRRSLVALAWGSAVGFTAELVGTTTGWPFGPYVYGEVLGTKLLGHVPITIPPSWYAIGLISYCLAAHVTERVPTRLLLGIVYMVLWDVALDPPMSFGFPAWSWQVDGAFYGMPLINLAGWAVTALVLLTGMARWAFSQGPAGQSAPWPTRIWLASAVLPIGISLTRGMWAAVVMGVIAVTVPLLLPRLRSFTSGPRNALPSFLEAVPVPVRSRPNPRGRG